MTCNDVDALFDALTGGQKDAPLPKTHSLVGAGKVSGEMMCPFHKSLPVKGVVFLKNVYCGSQSFISDPLYSDFHHAVKILYPFDTVKARQDTLLNDVWTFWKRKILNYYPKKTVSKFDWAQAEKKVEEERKNLKPKEKMEYHPNALLRKFYFDRMSDSMCGKPFCAWHEASVECAIITLDRTYDSWVLVPFCEDCVKKEKNKRPDYTEDLLYAVEVAMKKLNYLHIAYYCKWPLAYKETYEKVFKQTE
ncbi:unnamed protein product [Caenorhabditis bovis]|uniref:Uncharacterized protein n=1 Tax=Caenorhabditis bovis TaxID=2654633 RepID=A0A8S1FDX7_9PELO|nr:unnamed protein product [Caenorhabditis bovis]